MDSSGAMVQILNCRTPDLSDFLVSHFLSFTKNPFSQILKIKDAIQATTDGLGLEDDTNS